METYIFYDVEDEKFIYSNVPLENDKRILYFFGLSEKESVKLCKFLNKNIEFNNINTEHPALKASYEKGKNESCEVCEKASNIEYQKLFDTQRKLLGNYKRENAELKAQVQHLMQQIS